MKKTFFSTLMAGLITLLPLCPTKAQLTTTVRVNKIWDRGTHAAFTSLLKWQGSYYCTFREGYSHIFDAQGNAEGHVVILRSADGDSWQQVADLGMAGYDLRDPKLSEMPDGRLMVTIGGSIYRNRELQGAHPMVSFSTDGQHFTTPQPIEIEAAARSERDWVWRVTWHQGVGYGVSYPSAGKNYIDLLCTTDGIHYRLVKRINLEGFPNETTLRFLSDGRMAMMVRRDQADQQGYWGISAPPYTEWDLQPMGFRIGGQDFIWLTDDLCIVGTRTYFTSHNKTALFRGSPKGDWEEIYVLPSDGDTSYPGLLLEGNELWVSYYSSTAQPGKCAVYLAKLPLNVILHSSAHPAAP